jgi:hypothetical protein
MPFTVSSQSSKRARSDELAHLGDSADAADGPADKEGRSHSRTYRRESVEYVDLKSNGSNIVVDRGNRYEFVQLFVRYALYLCKKREVDSFIAGLKEFMHGSVLKMCSHNEVRV